MTRRTAVVDLGNGHSVVLHPLSPADMAALQRKHVALFDALGDGHRTGNLNPGQMWPRVLPCLYDAIAAAAGLPDEGEAVKAWPFLSLVTAAWKLHGLTFPDPVPAGEMFPISGKSSAPFSQIIAQLGAAQKFTISNIQ